MSGILPLGPYQKDDPFAPPGQTLQPQFTVGRAIVFHRNHPGWREACRPIFLGTRPRTTLSAMTIRPHDNCYWVIPGRLLAGEYPGAADKKRARERLTDIAAAGVRQFLDLTEPHELAPYAPHLAPLSRMLDRPLAHERWPIRDRDIPHTFGYSNQILDRMDDLLAAAVVPYVHCWGGVGRTGTIVGCWLVRHGHSGEQALAQLADWWDTVAKNDRHPRSPETDAQRQFVREWAQHDRVRRVAAAAP